MCMCMCVGGCERVCGCVRGEWVHVAEVGTCVLKKQLCPVSTEQAISKQGGRTGTKQQEGRGEGGDKQL